MRILAERTSRDGVRWIARVGDDRDRLEVVVIVPASMEPTVVPMLNGAELAELLAEGTHQHVHCWMCSTCGTANPRERSWCERCSTTA